MLAADLFPVSVADTPVPHPTAALPVRQTTPPPTKSSPQTPKPVITDPRQMPEIQKPIRNAKLMMARALPAVTEALIQSAIGVLSEKPNPKTGKMEVYSIPPNEKATKIIFDRVMGKDIEFQEITKNSTKTNITITLPDNGRTNPLVHAVGHEKADHRANNVIDLPFKDEVPDAAEVAYRLMSPPIEIVGEE